MYYINSYNELVKYLSKDYKEIEGQKFYSELFPDNQNQGEYRVLLQSFKSTIK